MKHYGKTLKTTKLKAQDKGHTAQFDKFIECVKEGKDLPISFEDIYLSSKATLLAIESIKSKRTILL